MSYLGLGTARLSQTLTGHLNCLVRTGKLCGFHKALLASLAIGIRDADQIRSLGRQAGVGVEDQESQVGNDSNCGEKENRVIFQGPM